MMILTDAEGALATLLNIMAMPAVFLICFGVYLWYKGTQQNVENRSRMGRMLLMFGVILLVIVLILSYFIAEYQIMRSSSNSAWRKAMKPSPIFSLPLNYFSSVLSSEMPEYLH